MKRRSYLAGLVSLTFAGAAVADSITLRDASRLEGWIGSTTAEQVYLVDANEIPHWVPRKDIARFEWRGKTEVLAAVATRPSAPLAAASAPAETAAPASAPAEALAEVPATQPAVKVFKRATTPPAWLTATPKASPEAQTPYGAGGSKPTHGTGYNRQDGAHAGPHDHTAPGTGGGRKR